MNEKYFCPVNAWDCPYWCENGECALGGEAPNQCDDAALWNKNCKRAKF